MLEARENKHVVCLIRCSRHERMRKNNYSSLLLLYTTSSIRRSPWSFLYSSFLFQSPSFYDEKSCDNVEKVRSSDFFATNFRQAFLSEELRRRRLQDKRYKSFFFFQLDLHSKLLSEKSSLGYSHLFMVT